MPHQRLVAQQPQIGHIVRALRQQLNLSQEKFAAHLGVSFQAVNRWENGRAIPLDAAEYKHVALGLIFLKYISDAFQELYDDLEARQETA